MPLSNHDGLQSDDCGQSIERSTRSDSVDKSSHRTSIFVEHHQDHHDLPPVWGKDSQPGYKGQRVLGLLPSLHPDGPYANSGPLGAYDPRYIEAARTIRPRPSDMGYEMPERYGGKEVAYGEESVIPLASNNNTWVPPVAQENRVCGVARWVIWVAFVSICLLIIGGAVGGVIAGVASSKKSAASGNSNSSSPIAASTASTSMSSSISTSTLSNGQVILITQVYTATKTNKPQTTIISQTTAGSFPASSTASTVSSSYNATSNSNPSSTTTTPASSSATSFSAGAYTLDCPSINGTTVSTTAGSTQYSYTIYCATDSTSSDMNVVTATSMLECYNACAQYSSNLGTICQGASFKADQSDGNCHLKGDVSSTFSFGNDNSIAIAVYQTKISGRWYHAVFAAE